MPSRVIDDASNPRHSRLWVPSYPQIVRNVNVLLAAAVEVSMDLCMTVVKKLATMYADAPVGVVLAVDGTGIPVNVVQVSSGGGADKERKEAHIRRRHPHAGFRILSQRPHKDDEGRKYTRTRVIRGYNWVLLSDVVVGLALDGILFDAQKLGSESWALRELLARLYTKWPDAPTRYITADSAWDVEEAIEHALRSFGICVITRRSITNRKAITMVPGKSKIAWINGHGEAFCREHGTQMRFVGVEIPDRDALGVPPGVELDAALYRARYEGDCGCGRASVKMATSWSALSPLPHTPHGRPDLHARRVAIYASRNTAESLFSSLKAGHAQGLAGSHRTRLNDIRSVEGLLWLTMAMRSLLQLRAVR